MKPPNKTRTPVNNRRITFEWEQGRTSRQRGYAYRLSQGFAMMMQEERKQSEKDYDGSLTVD